MPGVAVVFARRSLEARGRLASVLDIVRGHDHGVLACGLRVAHVHVHVLGLGRSVSRAMIRQVEVLVVNRAISGLLIFLAVVERE